jgi:hypothetical protein
VIPGEAAPSAETAVGPHPPLREHAAAPPGPASAAGSGSGNTTVVAEEVGMGGAVMALFRDSEARQKEGLIALPITAV